MRSTSRSARSSGSKLGGALLSGLRALERGVVAALMLCMAAAYAFNVAVRELAPSYLASFAWIEEACLFSLAWVVFLALGLALERGRHIAMTSIYRRFAPSLRRPVKFAIDLTGAAFSIYIAKLALDITLFVLQSGQSSPTLDISMAWLYAAMPVGFALLALRYLVELIAGEGRRAVAAPMAEH